MADRHPGLLRQWWWALFGTPADVVEEMNKRREADRLAAEAESYGIKPAYKKFWPPASFIYNERLPEGMKVWTANGYICPEMYDRQMYVPVFVDATHRYMYVITGTSRAGGSDHIVSPLEFDLEYVGREPLAA